MLSTDLEIVFPELLLVGGALLGLMIGVYGSKDRSTPLLIWGAVALMMLAAFLMFIAPMGSQKAFNGAFIDDDFARFAKVLTLFAASVMLLLSMDSFRKLNLLKFEYPILILLATAGMMMMISAGDLMSLYMGLELQSLALYVVASFNRNSERSTEAGLKYFVLGALSSGMLLYGASLVYGFTGSTNFADIMSVTSSGGASLGLVFGLVFVSVGLAFKVSAVPFHMWTPDVYEGSPTAVTAFFATAPKVAALALFARVLFDAFGNITTEWQQIIIFLSIASMFLGSIAAIGQTNIKRMMAYSSIGHVGFLLMGLAAGNAEGVSAMLIYLFIYVLMNIGVFAFILNMERDGKAVTDISALGGYSTVDPLRAAALSVLMFSLAGIPPFLGFFAKFYVIKAALGAGLFWLAILGVIASVIGAFYYLRIVYYMYFGEPTEPLTGTMPLIHKIALIASALAMVFGIINMFGIEPWANIAAYTLLK